MPIVGRYFPSQRSKEKVFLVLRRHWFTYVGFIIISAIMLVPLAIFILYASINTDLFSGIFGNIFVLVASAYALAVLGANLYGFVDYYLDIYIVTNERIVNIIQNGFFKRDVSELNLHQVQDVNASVKGIFATLFHYGDIYIQTAGEKENFIFKSIPHPYRVSRKIIDLLEEALEAARLRTNEEALQAETEVMKNDQQVATTKEDTVNAQSKVVEEITGINPSTFKIARQRTKEYLAGSDLEPSLNNFSGSDEITSEDSGKIIGMIDRDEANYSFRKDKGDGLFSKIDESKNNNKQAAPAEIVQKKEADVPAATVKDDETKIEPKEDSSDEHELTENQEIDL